MGFLFEHNFHDCWLPHLRKLRFNPFQWACFDCSLDPFGALWHESFTVDHEIARVWHLEVDKVIVRVVFDHGHCPYQKSSLVMFLLTLESYIC